MIGLQIVAWAHQIVEAVGAGPLSKHLAGLCVRLKEQTSAMHLIDLVTYLVTCLLLFFL